MLRIYKLQQVDKSENKEEWGLNIYISDDYILFITFSKKESNYPLTLNKETKGLTNLIYIPKKLFLREVQFCFRVFK